MADSLSITERDGPVGIDLHVKVGRRDIDRPVVQAFALFGRLYPQSRRTLEDRRENVLLARRAVQDNQDGRGQVRRQGAEHRLEGGDPASRCGDRNEVRRWPDHVWYDVQSAAPM